MVCHFLPRLFKSYVGLKDYERLTILKGIWRIFWYFGCENASGPWAWAARPGQGHRGRNPSEELRNLRNSWDSLGTVTPHAYLQCLSYRFHVCWAFFMLFHVVSCFFHVCFMLFFMCVSCLFIFFHICFMFFLFVFVSCLFIFFHICFMFFLFVFVSCLFIFCSCFFIMFFHERSSFFSCFFMFVSCWFIFLFILIHVVSFVFHVFSCLFHVFSCMRLLWYSLDSMLAAICNAWSLCFCQDRDRSRSRPRGGRDEARGGRHDRSAISGWARGTVMLLECHEPHLGFMTWQLEGQRRSRQRSWPRSWLGWKGPYIAGKNKLKRSWNMMVGWLIYVGHKLWWKHMKSYRWFFDCYLVIGSVRREMKGVWFLP